MSAGANQEAENVPIAQVQMSVSSCRWIPERRFTWLWLVAAAALVISIVLVVVSWRARGPRITVRFEHGHSIEPGDRLRHRGIEAGEVTSVTLDEDLGGVRMTIAVEPDAAALAREGSQFWIERPQVSLTRVSGLETIVGGQYLAVLPGPVDAPRKTQFAGLEAPPVGELAPGGLEILLEADQLGGLQPRAPITYRGVQVGRVIGVGLATDAASVTAHAFIEPAYVQLIRDNTQFWRKSGLDVSVGLSGVELDVESLSSVAMGGVSFATEEPPGKPVKTGHTFTLHDQADDEWLEWRPRVPVGSELLPEGLSLPRPLRASLQWRERKFGIRRTQTRQSWILPLADGRLLGPDDMLAPNLPEETGLTLQVAGREIPVAPAPRASDEEASDDSARLAVLDLNVELDGAHLWPIARVRRPAAPEDCLIVGSTDASVVPVAASRFTRENGRWRVDPSLPVSRTKHHGACVVATSDGSLVGLAIVGGQNAFVALVPRSIAN
jgi:hypothetical protein